jgi:hypothetical protein
MIGRILRGSANGRDAAAICEQKTGSFAQTSTRREGALPHASRCPKCYVGGGLVKFAVTSMVDADGVDLATETDNFE